MSWRDRLKTAQFRGVSFKTDDHTAQYGNRLVVHEFPGAALPIVEDLGGKSPEWQVNAYFLGADYDLARDKFLAELAKPGPDKLVHPWLGRLLVWAQTWSVTESTEQGGYCRIAITFVPGIQRAGQALTDKSDKAVQRIKSVKAKAKGFLGLVAMVSAEVNQFVAAVQGQLDKLRMIISVAQMPLVWASQLGGLVGSINSELSALLALPGGYANAIGGLFDGLGLGQPRAESNVSSIVAVQSSLIADIDRPRLVGLVLTLMPLVDPSAAALAKLDTPTQFGVLEFNLAHNQVFWAVLVVCAACELALVDYRTAADRDAVQSRVVLAIDGLVPLLPDSLFFDVLALRADFIDAMQTQVLAASVARVVVSPVPAVVLAFKLQQDVEVFMSRNNVRHPLFVQGEIYG